MAAALSAVGITLLFYPHHTALFSFPRAADRHNGNQSFLFPGKPGIADLRGQAPYAKLDFHLDRKQQTLFHLPLSFGPWQSVFDLQITLPKTHVCK